MTTKDIPRIDLIELATATRELGQVLTKAGEPLSEEEWDYRFRWSPIEGGGCHLLEDTQAMRQILSRHGVEYIWSQLDDPSNNGTCLIVPGMVRGAIGYYLCEVARQPEDEKLFVRLEG